MRLLQNDPSTPVIDRILKNYIPEPNTGCWLWQGSVRRRGYPVLTVQKGGRKTLYSVHRFMCENAHGPLGDLYALHKCDNPYCINPDHLRPGTNKENTKDAFDRGRRAGGDCHPNASLNTETVKAIRESGRSSVDLAKEYGVTVGCVSKIRTRRTWKHVA